MQSLTINCKTTTGYLDASLNTTAYFRSLEQSEKVGVSFLFGEAFTHWYAQSQMSVQYLVHVAGLASCRWGSPTAEGWRSASSSKIASRLYRYKAKGTPCVRE